MANFKKCPVYNTWSASMPVLNVFDDSVDDAKEMKSYPGLRSNSFVSLKVKKWNFPSKTSLIRPSTSGNAHKWKRSTPATPQDLDIDRKSSEATAATPTHEHLIPSRVFNKTERHAIKQLSTSTPAMAHAHSVARGPTEPDGSAGAPMTTKMSDSSELAPHQGSQKARQKKFNRHFKQVGSEEKVLDYYSCALIGDILLQGRLYVTKNYFAFYSNVFGYVTKLLIPMVDVMDVSKEKTAKIIPNAIGISTEDEKHVFGSLLSRDSTYKFMVEVWQAAKCPDPAIEIAAPKTIKNDVEDSASGDLLMEDDSTGSGSGNEEGSVPAMPLPNVPSAESFKPLVPKLKTRNSVRVPVPKKTSDCWSRVRPATILAISTALLVSLYLSAGFLLYRIAVIQNHFSDYPLMTSGEDMYHDILKWQSELHSRSANEVHEFLNANLNQIAKVRLSLEALSMLILTGTERERDAEKNSESPEEETAKALQEKSGDGNVS